MNFDFKITYEEPVKSGKNTRIKAHGLLSLDGHPVIHCDTTERSVCEGIARAKESATRKLYMEAVKYVKWVIQGDTPPWLLRSAFEFIDEANAKIATIGNE